MATEIRFQSIAPTYVVKDMERAVAYYRDVLGFDPLFLHGDPPTYAVLKRDDVHIHLFPEHMEHHQAGFSNCYVNVDNVEALHREYVSKGVPIVHELKVKSYGMKDFVIADLDGNHLGFGEECTGSA